MKQQYYLSIKGGTGTYAVFLAILSSVLAGLITSCNVQWSVVFIISIILLIIGIAIVAWLNIACIKFNERYSDINNYENIEDRKTQALDKTAVDDFNNPKEDGAGKKFEKKFNKHSYLAIALSFTSIVLIVCNNIYQNYNNPTSSTVKECNCGSNNNQEQGSESISLADSLNYQHKESKQTSVCKDELDTVLDVHQIKTIQETSKVSIRSALEGEVYRINKIMEGHVPETND